MGGSFVGAVILFGCCTSSSAYFLGLPRVIRPGGSHVTGSHDIRTPGLGSGNGGDGWKPPSWYWGFHHEEGGDPQGHDDSGAWHMMSGLSALSILSRKWPPKCLEILAPNSTVLDKDILQGIVENLRLAGAKLDKHKLRAVMSAVDRHYLEQGYVGSRVRTVSAHENGTVFLDVLERRVADQPVTIKYAKYKKVPNMKTNAAAVLDSPAAAALSKDVTARNEKGVVEAGKADGKEVSQVVMTPATKGKTRPRVAADAMGLRKGQVFRFEPQRYERLLREGPFEKALVSVVPKGEKLGLEMLVVEKPSLILEPGVSKSLHTRDWMGDVFFEDRNLFGLNQMLCLKVRKGLIRGHHEPCLTVSADFHDNPLRGGALPSFSVYRDPVAHDWIREGGLFRFAWPLSWRGKVRTSIDFSADRLTNHSIPRSIFGRSLPSTISPANGMTVTSVGGDVSMRLGMLRGQQDVDMSVATGLCFDRVSWSTRAKSVAGGAWDSPLPSTGWRGGRSAFTRGQLVGTTVNPIAGFLTLATRHVGYLARASVPGYLAYRMGGRYYVRGFDDQDFAPFTRMAGGTTELRLPLLRTESGRSGCLTAFGFVDYARGKELGSSRWNNYLSGGVGLTLGPIKVDYAVNSRYEGKIHVSLVDPTF